MHSALRVVLLVASSLVLSGLAACTPCRSFTYSSCPDRCVRRCVSSGCGQDQRGETICTEDCEGPGSCVSPDEPTPELESAERGPSDPRACSPATETTRG